MGNYYTAPERKGTSPYTRTGEPVPKLKSLSEQSPHHLVHDPMSLELHMADERMRTAGLSDAEREWRQKWLKDQHLHVNEPVHVDAVHRQLNPIRLLIRMPMDKLYVHYLRPTFGVVYGAYIRITLPKMVVGFLFIEYLYYWHKYEDKGWQGAKKAGAITPDLLHVPLETRAEIEKKHPGILKLGLTGKSDPEGFNWYHPSFKRRDALIDVGETRRPW